ncbi:MAG TPA: hypothetical protein VK506_04610 [Conexibacter sp.]|nr:hypothetical protein [Conexibacter sp.]
MTDAAGNDAQPTAEQAALGADVPADVLTAEALAAAAPAIDGSAPAYDPAAGGAALASVADDRPEMLVGAAFAGGFALAFLLKRLAR